MTLLDLTLTATAQASMTTPAGQVCVTKAGQDNLFEINAANIALSLGKSQAVKDHARRMITDHTRLGDDVKAALNGTNLTPPTVSPDQQRMLDLLKLSGPAFDAIYTQMMVMSHDDTYTVFQSYAKVGQTASLKSVIGGALPTVKMLWDMAKHLPST